MEIYLVNLGVLAVLLGVAAYWQHQLNETKVSLFPPHMQKSDSLEMVIDDEIHNTDHDTTADRFFDFRNQFLCVYGLSMAADWLQGSFMYSLYKHTHELPESVIATLFAAGFLSGGVSATFLGTLIDRFGRKLACLSYCAIYSLSCLTMLSSNVGLLLFGRVLGGVSTTLLFTAFETWMISEYRRLGFGHADSALSSIYGTMSILNGFVAVTCGVIAQFLVHVSGSEMAPFIASIACLILTAVLIARSWVENYGTPEPASSTNTPKPRASTLSDPSLLSISLAACFVEGSMYIMIYAWSQAIMSSRKLALTPGKPPFGLIFANFMCALTLGSFGFIYTTRGHNSIQRSSHMVQLAISLSATCLLLTVFAEGELYRFWALCIFEFCLGLYFPSMGYLKVRLVSDDQRGRIYGFMRSLLNAFVVLFLVTIKEDSWHAVVCCCSVSGRWPASKSNEHLFSYTSGRFIFNENLRQKERYVKFNVEAFKELAAEHIGPGHGKVTDITKFAEGGFNRVFLLTMEDSFQAIAKIPYQIAVPKRYATASEAATLELLRLKGIPVPKVYGYSASIDNSAGVEYIIMEKANGVRVEEKWFSMAKRERHKLASSFVEIEKKLFDLPFNSIGSVYFKSDLPPNLHTSLYSKAHQCHKQDVVSERFCIGPIADYMFWFGKRAGLDIHRGPWNDPTDYLRSIAEREIEWIRKNGKPLELDFPYNGYFPGKHSPTQYLELLKKYLALVPYLLPKENSDSLNQPTLRHPDLNPNNIFIHPDTGAISCIIDWQHTTIEPRLLVAGYPRAFENPDIESLDADEKAEAEELYRRQTLFYYYRIFNGGVNKPHLKALRDPLLHPRKHLVGRAGRQWSGNLITLKGALVRMAEYWPLFPDTQGIQCPIEFGRQELEEFQKHENIWYPLTAASNHWRDELGVSEDGWVSNDNYEDAIRKVRELKEHLIAESEGDEGDIALLNKGWPFRDHEEVN